MRGVEIQSALMGLRIGVSIVECPSWGVLHEGSLAAFFRRLLLLVRILLGIPAATQYIGKKSRLRVHSVACDFACDFACNFACDFAAARHPIYIEKIAPAALF